MNRQGSTLAEQLAELLCGPLSDEYGRLRPTRYAHDKALSLLGCCENVPRGCVSTDSEGGVRIEWVKETASVHLVVPYPIKSPYIYHEIGGDYATENATPKGLAHWLEVIEMTCDC